MPTIEVVEAWRGPGRADGEIIVPPLKENGQHDATPRGTFEHWYFDARLDDGHIVVGFLQTSELITKRPGVELHVYRPDGTRLEIRKPYPKAACRASDERCDVRVGHNFAHVVEDPDGGLPKHVVHLEEDGIRFDLAFQSTVEPWQPGGGRTTFGPKDFFAWVVPAPRADVTGTVTIEGQTMEVHGTGYHDHNWGIGFMPRIVGRWYWGRIYAEDFTLVYATIGLNEKRFGPESWITPLMLAHGEKVVLSTGEVTMDVGRPVFNTAADNSYPATLGLTAPGVSLRLDVKRIIHAHSFLDDIPLLGKPRVKPLVKPAINRLAGHPGYFRFESEFTLEATVDGLDHTRTGLTTHEMVALR
jgi:hypothetical protein